MSVAVILPARLASTRLPKKLLLAHTGRTILEHSIGQALEAQRRSSGLIQRVLVACDDEQLWAAAKKSGADAVMTDPGHLSGTDRIAEAAAALPEEIIVNHQPDEPEIDPDALVQVARLLDEGAEEIQMATLCVPIMDEVLWRNENVVKAVLDHRGRALYFSRAPIPYIRDVGQSTQIWTSDKAERGGRQIFGLHHLGIYAYRRKFLLNYKNLPESRLEKLEKLEQLRALEAGYPIQVGMAKPSPPGIDTREDYDGFLKRWKAGSQTR